MYLHISDYSHKINEQAKETLYYSTVSVKTVLCRIHILKPKVYKISANLNGFLSTLFLSNPTPFNDY